MPRKKKMETRIKKKKVQVQQMKIPTIKVKAITKVQKKNLETKKL